LKLRTALLSGGLVALGAAFSTSQAHAQAAPFLDTPTNHWAYESVQDLAKRGIVIGYPDGTYGGKRPMTRYEFAVAIERALLTIDAMVKAQAGTPAPVGTPPATALTQDQLNEVQALIDKFRPELDTIQADLKTAQDNIDALRADVLDTKALANKAQATADNSYGVGANRKFQISGYIQGRFTAVSAGQGGPDYPTQSRFPQGTSAVSGGYNGNYSAGGNTSTFDIRRARIKFTGQVTPNTKYGLQIDASGAVTAGTNANQQVTTREGYVAYTGGDGNPAKNLTVTAGLFALPFGYIVPVSSATYITPERPLAFSEAGYGLFATQDYDKGIQFSYNTAQQLAFLPAGLKLTAAIVNGTGRTSDATDKYRDQVYRVAYQSTDKVFSVGTSYYLGQVNVPAVPTNLTSPTVFNPVTGVTSPGPITGTGYQYTGRKKELYGFDTQIVLPSGPFLNAEYVGGLYEQRSYFATSTATAVSTAYAKDNHVDGYYVQGGFTFGQAGTHPLTLAASYDVLKRGEGKNNGYGAGSDAYTDKNLGYGALYNLDKATRLRFWYTRPDHVAHLPNATDSNNPHRYGLFTGEIQVKF